MQLGSLASGRPLVSMQTRPWSEELEQRPLPSGWQMRSRDSTQALWGPCPEGTLLHPPAHVPLSVSSGPHGGVTTMDPAAAAACTCAPDGQATRLLWASSELAGVGAQLGLRRQLGHRYRAPDTIPDPLQGAASVSSHLPSPLSS